MLIQYFNCKKKVNMADFSFIDNSVDRQQENFNFHLGLSISLSFELKNFLHAHELSHALTLFTFYFLLVIGRSNRGLFFII